MHTRRFLAAILFVLLLALSGLGMARAAIIGCSGDPSLTYTYAIGGGRDTVTQSLSWGTSTQINGSVASVTVQFHVPLLATVTAQSAPDGETVQIIKDLAADSPVYAVVTADAASGYQWSYSGTFSVTGSRNGQAAYGPAQDDTTVTTGSI